MVAVYEEKGKKRLFERIQEDLQGIREALEALELD